MSFDTLVTGAVAAELEERILGARIQRVYQPDRNEVVLYLYRSAAPLRLLLSCHAQRARVHLTNQQFENPEQPGPFCMLLRKYLVGGKLSKISRPAYERILHFSFSPPEGMAPVSLIAEIMGRRSNLILVDERGIILGAIKTNFGEQNRYRTVQPGKLYLPPPPQQKPDPHAIGPVELTAALTADHGPDEAVNPERALVAAVQGVSPLTARELLYRSRWDHAAPDLSASRLHHEMKKLFRECSTGPPQAFLSQPHKAYAAFALTHLPAEEQVCFQSINEMLDRYYTKAVENEKTVQLRELLLNRINKQLARLRRKLAEQQQELNRTGEAPRFRLYGETLLAYAGRVPRGADRVKLPDLYQPDKSITIPLDPSLTAGANAQKYFSRYRKAHKGKEQIQKQIRRTGQEISYCEGLLFNIENSSLKSLEEIREEFFEAGYLRAPKKTTKKKSPLPQPLTLKASSGRTILIGMNNHQNDYLTFKAAARRDTWLHAHDLPGAHVIIKDTPFPPAADDLEEAALLAAHFSRGKEQNAVAVDYTEVRHVRRGPGGKPGFALYENFQTITVDPRDKRLHKLLPSAVP